MEAAGFRNISRAGVRSKLLPTLAKPCVLFELLKSVSAKPLSSFFGFCETLTCSKHVIAAAVARSGGHRGSPAERAPQEYPDLGDCSAIPGDSGAKPAWPYPREITPDKALLLGSRRMHRFRSCPVHGEGLR